MSLMELLSDNILNTTTMLKVDSNTSLAQYLFDRNIRLVYETSGYTTNTSTIISIEFDNPTVISNIILQNHNFKQFRFFYNSATANVFSPDIIKTTNSETSSYFLVTSITVNSIQLQIDLAISADTEKKIGELIVCERELQFPQNPTIKQFKPKLDRIQIRHVMSDGGITLFNIKDKYKAKIGFRYITSSFYNSLLSIFEEAKPLYFIPFPTTTAWNGNAYPVVWSGDFDFKYSANVKESGYSGNIMLEERSSGG